MVGVSPSHVILLKNKTVPVDDYQEVFSSNEVSTTFVPLLKHEHLNKNEILEFLTTEYFLQESKALIITSQRAVEVLNDCMVLLVANSPAVANVIFNKPSYTVGPATAKILAKAGFQDIRGGSDAGNGNILADIIMDDPLFKGGADKQITFFTGEIRKDIIPKKLLSNGFDLYERVIYRTIYLSDIVSKYMEAISLLDTKSVNWVVFFSPQGTEKIVEHLVTLKQNGGLRNLKLASIGPTTEIYLKEKGLVPDVVAKKPHAESLFETIFNYQ